MLAYASVEDIQNRMTRPLTVAEQNACISLLADASVLIDAYRSSADADAKKLVSCRMVIRAIGSASVDIPVGASQASQSALGYTQSWTISGGSAGELYLSKTDKQLLGGGNSIGAVSPLEALI